MSITALATQIHPHNKNSLIIIPCPLFVLLSPPPALLQLLFIQLLEASTLTLTPSVNTAGLGGTTQVTRLASAHSGEMVNKMVSKVAPCSS